MQRFHTFPTPRLLRHRVERRGPDALPIAGAGQCGFAATNGDGRSLGRALPSPIGKAVAELERYFHGEEIDFSTLQLDIRACGSFHKAVYAATRSVRWGGVATYGEIARVIGSPGAARAVGHALSRNPIAVIIPCHRILAAGGKIGGFSAHGGAEAKTRLLEIEGARHRRGASANPDLFATSFG